MRLFYEKTCLQTIELPYKSCMQSYDFVTLALASHLRKLIQHGKMQRHPRAFAKLVRNLHPDAEGGCGTFEDVRKVVSEGGASAASAGSLFVFHGPRRAVLINFPTQTVLRKLYLTS